MKIKILCAIALLSTSVFANDPAVPEQMMRGRSSQYQDGFRDGFREAVRMMNSSNNNWNNGGGDYGGNTIRILTAMYGSHAGTCDFTDRLARTVEGKSSYFFKPSNSWCGDPSNHVAKEARIEYRCSQYGRTKRVVVPEGRGEYLRCN